MRRLAALLYDVFLVAAVLWMVGITFNFVFGNANVQSSPILSNLLFLCMVAGTAAFYVGFWCAGGQTLGMIAWRLRVQDPHGRRLNLRQALIRFALAWPAFFLFGVGYLWIYRDPGGDALHDKLSGSRVVVLPKDFSPFK
ncbi:MAG: RDD family protein [Pseudohongiellaceae bacterium]